MELRQPVRITGRDLVIMLTEMRNARAFHKWYLHPSTQELEGC
jgi:hypothetical protein